MDGKPQSTLQLSRLESDLAQVPKDKLWSEDVLGRKDTANEFEAIITGQRGPLTIGLNGAWGCGKSFFLERLVRQYADKGGRAIYYNAWKDDFLGDPLLSIIGQLKHEFKNGQFAGSIRNIVSAGCRLVGKVGLGYVKTKLKDKTGLDFDSVDLADFGGSGTSPIKEYEQAIETREKLLASLRKLGREVFDKTGRPLLFVVDEIDRCRPTFAIETLERIKHLFSVENIVFVIGMDSVQLKKSICSVYGDVDAHDYLHRFIKVEMMLPLVDSRKFVNLVWRRLRIDERLDELKLRNRTEMVKDDLARIVRFRGPSLRQIEIILTQFSLIAFSRNENSASWEHLVAVAVVLKVLNPELYRQYISMDVSPKDLLLFLFPGMMATDFYAEDAPRQIVEQIYLAAYYRNERSAFARSVSDAYDSILKGELSNSQKSLFPEFITRGTQDDQLVFLKKITGHDQYWRYGDYKYIDCRLKEIDQGLSCISNISL